MIGTNYPRSKWVNARRYSRSCKLLKSRLSDGAYHLLNQGRPPNSAKIDHEIDKLWVFKTIELYKTCYTAPLSDHKECKLEVTPHKKVSMAEQAKPSYEPNKTTAEKALEIGLNSVKASLMSTPMGVFALLTGCSSPKGMQLYTATKEDQKTGLNFEQLEERVGLVSRTRDTVSKIRSALSPLEEVAKDPKTLEAFIRANPKRMAQIAEEIRTLGAELEIEKASPHLVAMKTFGLSNKLRNIPQEIKTTQEELAATNKSTSESPLANRSLQLLMIDVRSALVSSSTLLENLRHDKEVLTAANYKHKQNLERYKRNAATIEEYQDLAENLDPVLEKLDKLSDGKIDFAYFSARPAEKLELMNALWNSEQMFRALAKQDKHDYFLIRSPSQIADGLSELRESLRDPAKFESRWKWNGSRPYNDKTDDWGSKDAAWSLFQSVQQLQTRIDEEAKKLSEAN